MTLEVAIMLAVAAVLAAAGVVLLLLLARPRTPAQVYVFRMVGIMALFGGIVLAMSATAMWRWTVSP